jgi:dipeptidyl aminopeptidase/acylaminoacyl peptidase
MAAKNAKRGMQPDDILKVRWVSDARISPDGNRVAYVVTTLDREKNESLSRIHLAEVKTGESRPLTNGPKRDTSPRWSPDGGHLAFVSERGEEKAQVWVLPMDGGEAWPATKETFAASNPAWSPDGKRIAYNVRVEPEPEKGADGKPLPRVRTITTLKYKMNGEGFVDDKRRQIAVVEVDAVRRKPGESIRLTRGDYNHGEPVWSPDGKSIAFAAARHASRDRDGASDAWVISAEGGRPTRLTRTRGPVNALAWSPDRKSIAYLGHEDRYAGGAINHRLWLVAAGGGHPRCLTPDFEPNCASDVMPPTWTADGGALLFGVLERGSCPVYQVPAAGGPCELVIGGDRQLAGATMAAGSLAFIASYPDRPAEVFSARVDGSRERQVTRENQAWLDEVDLARAEQLEAKSADGTMVQAWVMRPPGERRSAARLPCLLNVHGGPHTQYGQRFFDEFQVYAAAGYVVVYGNPRGSQGYGETFSSCIRGAWGGKDWQDVQAIADAADALPDVDGSRVAIMGGSYGGFMTSWAIGQTDRFAAACSERAVNNLYSMVGSSDIGWSFQTYEIGGTPFEDPERYLRMSPVHYLKNIKTPLLILHSENDLRCPIEQAEQLYVGLKLLRRPVRFVRFPEENHEMSRSGKPRHRLKRFEIILDWFGEQLAPERGERERARKRRK